jgi:hypothetical protein
VFFWELPQPVLPREQHQDLLLVMRAQDEAVRFSALEGHLKELPDPAIRTLRKLLSSLELVASKSSANQMKVRDLAEELSPALFQSGSAQHREDQAALLAFMIENWKSLFQVCLFLL